MRLAANLLTFGAFGVQFENQEELAELMRLGVEQSAKIESP